MFPNSEKLADAKQSLTKTVWQADLRAAPWWQRFLIRTVRICIAVGRDLMSGTLNLRAMSLVYTTIISLVPLLAFSFSVLKGFGVHNQLKPLLMDFLQPLGERGSEIADRIIEFVDNVQVGVLGALGLGLLIYTVISMMQKIEESFNYIWRVSQGRNFAQKFSDYLSVILVGPFLIFVSVGLTASIRSHAVVTYLSSIPGMGGVLELIGRLLPYVIMAFAFAFIYVYVPNTRVKLGSALIGGLVTAIAWKTMGWVFSEFLIGSNVRTAIYSAFASIFIFMLWLYLGWLILLVGASITYYHQNPQYVSVDVRNPQLSNSAKEKLGLMLMYSIAHAYHYGEPAWSARRFQEILHLPSDYIGAQIQILIDAGVIMATDKSPTTYLPAKPLQKITVAEVLKVLRNPQKNYMSTEALMKIDAPVENLFDDYTQLVEKNFSALSFVDLVQAKPADQNA